MKASLFKRVTAYFIDAIILSIIVSIISFGFTSEKYEKALEETKQLSEKYLAQEITEQEYFEKSNELTYDMQKSNVKVSIVMIITTIAYFVVFQYLNKGQTLGKKLLKLKIKENEKEPSLKAMIIRTIFVNNIFSTTVGVILLYALTKNNYTKVYNITTSVETIFILVSVMFILYRKDKRGLHDIIAKTEVIEEK